MGDYYGHILNTLINNKNDGISIPKNVTLGFVKYVSINFNTEFLVKDNKMYMDKLTSKIYQVKSPPKDARKFEKDDFKPKNVVV